MSLIMQVIYRNQSLNKFVSDIMHALYMID